MCRRPARRRGRLRETWEGKGEQKEDKEIKERHKLFLVFIFALKIH